MKTEQNPLANPQQPSAVASGELLCWLRVKLDDAERALKAREQMETTWRGGSDESWKDVANYLKSQTYTKAERIKEADRQCRIAVKCRREVEMFKAAIVAISQHNNQAQARPEKTEK